MPVVFFAEQSGCRSFTDAGEGETELAGWRPQVRGRLRIATGLPSPLGLAIL